MIERGRPREKRGIPVAAAGQIVNETRFVPEPPHAVSQAVIAATGGVPDYVVSAPGPGSIVLTRQYRPTWTIIVAVIGFLFFLIGLLALLVKNTEALTLTLSESDGGTTVTITGVATPEMLTRVNVALGGMPSRSEPELHGTLTHEGDTKVCPSCAETVKAAATKCRFCGHAFEDVSPSEVT
ncbi:MAG TPA: zinc ribbon domain-containing protein [Solirubrobacteraceae bacterium]|nr:zinc ribbon domain-containing protein [Solirubrobacteraceae bacterium]